MSLQEDYDKEQYNRQKVEIEGKGYATYNIYNDGSMYVHHMYVAKESRGQGIGLQLEQLLLKEKPKIISAYIDMTANNREISLLAFLHAGYKLDGSTNAKIFITKHFTYSD